MRHHYRLFSETKQQYQDLFLQAKASLIAHLQTLRPAMACPVCEPETHTPPPNRDSLPLTRLHANCPNRHWQAAILHFLETELARDILRRLEQIGAYRNTFSCHMCGMCCRLASSEHAYPELLQRAAQGDEFARQFTSIFLPYASREAARAKYPDIVAAVLAHVGETIATDSDTLPAPGQANPKPTGAMRPPAPSLATRQTTRTSASLPTDPSPALLPPANDRPQPGQPLEPSQANLSSHQTTETVFFYHCPYIGEDNRCTVYGTDKRPAICENYPETSLGFVYQDCAWKPWQDETHLDTLLAHGLLNLCQSWIERLRNALTLT